MNMEHKYKDKDEYKDNDKDKDAERITESLTVCYIFGILMTQAFQVSWLIPSVTNVTNVTNITNMTTVTTWDPVGLPLDPVGPCRPTP